LAPRVQASLLAARSGIGTSQGVEAELVEADRRDADQQVKARSSRRTRQ
jgi:hypothetical protein